MRLQCCFCFRRAFIHSFVRSLSAQPIRSSSGELPISILPTPADISTPTCQIQTGWSPHSKRSFER